MRLKALRKRNNMTKKYGILAYPAKHSLSPAVQNSAFKAVGFDAEFGIFEIPENELAGFMEQVKHEPISGLSVSAPYKEVVMGYLNEIASDAREIGAVNTVVNRGGNLYGYNVDYIGMNKALEEVVGNLAGKKVVVLGAGGAAKACVYGLLTAGASVAVYNRSAEKAFELAKHFNGVIGEASAVVKAGGLTDIPDVGADILVQTTSIWMTDTDANLADLIPEEMLKNFGCVMDIVYKPLETPLIKAAMDLGIKTITGDKMFLYQAMEQFKLWTGEEAPIKVMRKALENTL